MQQRCDLIWFHVSLSENRVVNLIIIFLQMEMLGHQTLGSIQHIVTRGPIPSSSTKQPPVNNGLYFKVAGFQKLPQTALACLKSLAKSSTKRETNFEPFESFNILHFGGPFRVVILLCTALRQCLEFKAWAVMEWCELRVSAVSASRCRCTVAQKQLLSADSVELVELRL